MDGLISIKREVHALSDSDFEPMTPNRFREGNINKTSKSKSRRSQDKAKQSPRKTTAVLKTKIKQEPITSSDESLNEEQQNNNRSQDRLTIDPTNAPTHTDIDNETKSTLNLSQTRDVDASEERPERNQSLAQASSRTEDTLVPSTSASSEQTGQVKVAIPQSFVPVSTRQMGHCSKKDPNTELWLVQVPAEFDVTTLHNRIDSSLLDIDGSKTVKVKDGEEKKRYSLSTYRNSFQCKKLSVLTPTADCRFAVGYDVQNMLVLTESFKSSDDKEQGDPMPPPKAQIPMPTGLRVRFSPFGTESPEPCESVSHVPKTKTHSPKGNKLGLLKEDDRSFTEPVPLEAGATLSSPQKKKKKSKKEKHSPCPETTASISPVDSQHKQLDLKFNHSANAFPGEIDSDSVSSPRKKKKKLKKHKHSPCPENASSISPVESKHKQDENLNTEEFIHTRNVNQDEIDSESVSSPKKKLKKKHKRSSLNSQTELAVSNSPVESTPKQHGNVDAWDTNHMPYNSDSTQIDSTSPKKKKTSKKRKRSLSPVIQPKVEEENPPPEKKRKRHKKDQSSSNLFNDVGDNNDFGCRETTGKLKSKSKRERDSDVDQLSDGLFVMDRGGDRSLNAEELSHSLNVKKHIKKHKKRQTQ